MSLSFRVGRVAACYRRDDVQPPNLRFAPVRGKPGCSQLQCPLWRDLRPAAYREDLQQVLRLVGEGHIKPLVGGTWPLTQVAEAHRALESRSVAGKIVLLP